MHPLLLHPLLLHPLLLQLQQNLRNAEIIWEAKMYWLCKAGCTKILRAKAPSLAQNAEISPAPRSVEKNGWSKKVGEVLNPYIEEAFLVVYYLILGIFAKSTPPPPPRCLLLFINLFYIRRPRWKPSLRSLTCKIRLSQERPITNSRKVDRL